MLEAYLWPTCDSFTPGASFSCVCRFGYNADMEESRRRQHRWKPWATLILTAALAYPLSLGPACMLLERTGYPPTAEEIVKVVYAPLLSLPEPIKRGIVWWEVTCTRFAMRR